MDIKKYYITIKVAFLKIMKKQGKIWWSNVKESTTQKHIFPDLEIGLIQTNVRKNYKKWRWMGMNVPLYLNII